ncbi:hypothetical protein HGA91_06170 [candidate division WWE3 bacterium]|nr:hypothetical protein [candidate division WWE3 bacterium]
MPSDRHGDPIYWLLIVLFTTNFWLVYVADLGVLGEDAKVVAHDIRRVVGEPMMFILVFISGTADLLHFVKWLGL